MRFFYTLFFFITGTSFLFSQTGSVSGRITTAKDEALSDAKIFISGTTNGTISDSTGNFELKNIPVGKTKIVFSYLSYENDTIEKNVPANQTLPLGNIVLKESSQNLNEVQITGTLEKGSENKAINLTKNSGRVVTVLSSETMSKLPDKNAAESVKRI